jgi:uncharacterized membrane protein (TIGR01666 family)
MKQTREIKTFIFSQYFTDGIRITIGVLMPSLILAQYGQLQSGIIISLGALCASIADNPGPLIHKRNGMLFCIAFVAISAVLTGFINEEPLLLMFEIPIFCFFFSMFTVYGNRASSVGTAILLIMILTMDRQLNTLENVINGLFLLSGGLWYFLLSMSVSQIRPYRMAQQTLGSCIREVGKYLEIKAGFYDIEKDQDENYKELIAQQVIVNHEQDTVREILFKSRLMIKESTATGRQLVMVFVDILDLFEQTMATHYDYRKIRGNFGETHVLEHFRDIIMKLGEELENLSYYVVSNEQPVPLYDFQPRLEKLKTEIDRIEPEYGINSLVLKKILVNMRNIVNRIQNIYGYYNPKTPFNEEVRTETDIKQFIRHQDYDLKVFKDNLSFKSDIFRHSLRVALLSLVGYLVAKSLFTGHHSYWVLLTILVILKPEFSQSKERNYQRLIGTFIGCIAGTCIVMFIKDETARFIIMLICMIGTFSSQRLNYAVSVLFMTPYILIMFSFIGLGGLALARERIFDTFVGSAIALLGSYLILPSWQHKQLKGFMRNVLIANYSYFKKAIEKLTGNELNITEYKLARKAVYVESADLASAFQRMLSEPKSKQKNAKEIHKFVVLNHTLSSYIATLISNIKESETRSIHQGDVKLMKKTLYQLCDAINSLNEEDDPEFRDDMIIADNARQLPEEGQDTKLITEQLEFVNNLSGDIQKITQRLKNNPLPESAQLA